jgi:putative hydrolase of the HAD superfamily
VQQGQIKVILCDLGKVLIDFNHEPAAKRMSNFCPKSPKEIFQLFFDSPATSAFESGKISPEEFYAQIKEMLDLKLSYASFVPIWNDIFSLSVKNRLVYAVLNSLQTDYKIALLSNINVLHYQHLQKNFPVFNVFHKQFLSYALGVAKPDKLIYQKVINDLGVSAEEIFYIDDRPELVQSARSLKIKSFVFLDVPQLKRDLASAGVYLI